LNLYPKTIEIPESFENLPKLSDIITPGMLLTSTQAFYRYMRIDRNGNPTERYFYSLNELGIMERTNTCPPLLYIGTVPNSFYLDHKFLIGTKFCFMYDDDFIACLPVTLTILNSNS